MNDPKPNPEAALDAAYDPETFRAQGHAAVDRLADYLLEARLAAPGGGRASSASKVFHGLSPAQLDEAWPGTIAREGSGELGQVLGELIQHSHKLHQAGYVGHQVAVPLPGSALVEMVSAFFNNGMAIYEMGPANVLCEQRVIEFLCRQVGWQKRSIGEANLMPSLADGFLTSGGSVGNLTALLAARQAQAGQDVWQQGASEPYCFLASAENHYCIDRAVRIMGWGAGGIEPVEVDERRRLRPERLQAAYDRAGARGRKVLGVIASVCTTATGSFDPLEPMADFCDANDLWLHADGAHGAAFLLHPERDRWLKGIERADSVVWDLHKMMLMPALSTAVLFREGRRSYEAFAQEASYLFEGREPEAEWYNLGQRTLECTKRGMGAAAYALLHSLGSDCLTAYLERMLQLTRGFASEVRLHERFELALEPEVNIVCFRFVFTGTLAEQNADQVALRDRVVAEGRFYLVRTELDGVVNLRVTIINAATSAADLTELLATLVRFAD